MWYIVHMNELIKELIEKTVAGKLTWTSELDDLGYPYRHAQELNIMVFSQTITQGNVVIYRAEGSAALSELHHAIDAEIEMRERRLEDKARQGVLAKLRRL